MRGLLVRVGADQSEGGGSWNGPIDRTTRSFAYVSIPECNARPGFEKPYSLVNRALATLQCCLPPWLSDQNMHLDPDFNHLTYGDQGQRAQQIREKLGRGDLIVFYAGLRDIRPNPRLVYALIGLYLIEEIVPASAVPKVDWDKNAHTRYPWVPSSDDVIVKGQSDKSGRLEKCVEIGCYRCAAGKPQQRPCYRVDSRVLAAWGGLIISDGYLQRSARLPEFCDAERFYEWFLKHNIKLLSRNN